ncbi:glycerol-3-phosphate 1-O-acyltransferase PlsY [Candidatus Xianfuyuplasma coldseepsis]|uniref:Glycerol-3-phosphate acyltransferase n=1 Tax=Candidatus Xianfuyuplasma coldseepsis TaxID=2782163 RepID=A0A7L7KR15_9MOLU|nr:glycerol-3-phosphate 1-O-acyltransferase PlsY [Xianfuyuplasma coldseepsis]QMS84394.1 glycerol-3-phosphate 1-O-acyltransferase PlsY [Xianfuyuplasma coldseepsis]
MIYALLFLASYLVGHINPAILVSRWRRGIDIREINSKNAGTSNVTMTIGYRWGIFVLLMDILKGLVPALIVRLVYPENDILWFVSGLGAILGHIYPVLYQFKGGKGTATFGGVLFATVPLYAVGLLLLFALVLYLTDYIALSTLVAIVLTPIVLYLMGFHWISVLLMLVFSFISFSKHFENYRRIWNKEEVGLRKFHRNKDQIRVEKNTQ